MKYLRIGILLFGLACIIVPATNVSAATFNAGSIISDGIFTNKSSMSLGEVTNFINAKNAACTDGEAPCLKNFSENGKSAAQIIYDTSQTYSINPQVLLVTLQKETGLLTKSGPGLWRYRSAMGYGCFDSTPGVCESAYFGFTNQVTWAAKMFRAIMNASPTWSVNYVVGNNFIYWNPNKSCGGSTVNIENRATQALYNYTPYQPNSAALSAGYGEGDGCSSYGNRNFFNYFNDWFGSPTIDGRVYVDQIDSVSDIDGEPAKLGFRLNFRPNYPVTVLVNVSNSSIAGVVGGVDRITIQPDNWDKPEQNMITIYGKDDGSSSTKQIYLQTTEVASYDPRFDLLVGSDVGDPSIVVQGGDRVVYRLYSPTLNRHTYTSRFDEVNALISSGYVSEGTAFYACEAGEQNIGRISKSGISLMVDMGSSEYRSAITDGYRLDGSLFSSSALGDVQVYRLRNQTNDYLYTTSVAEKDAAVAQYGYTFEGATFAACQQRDQPIFRLVNNMNGNHFYTKNAAERDQAGASGFTSEGIAFYLPVSATNVPVYRLLSSNGKDHFYTTNVSEKSFALAAGYRDEGIGFYLPNDTSTGTIYRLYSASKSEHFYTFFKNERDSVINSGLYKDEGTAFLTRP